MFSYIYIKEYELTAFWSVSRFLKQWNPLRKKELKDGEHVAFVGPSGGGETAGNLPPYDGNPDAGHGMELVE